MSAHSLLAHPQRDEPSCVLRGPAVALSHGRIEVTYLAPGEPPRITIAGKPLALEDVPPAPGTAAYALFAGLDSILISDRDARLAILVPRDGLSLLEEHAPLYVAGPDPRRAGRFRVEIHRASAPTSVMYVAQSFGHTTGWVPARPARARPPS